VAIAVGELAALQFPRQDKVGVGTLVINPL
jgi:hypothetical protein